MKDIRLFVIAGARPNFMKIQPFLKEIAAHNKGRMTGSPQVHAQLIHTGQHYDQDMSDVFFKELGIQPPDVNLGVGSGSQATQTAGIMTGFEPLCLQEKPDWVVVFGDVNSTLACTLVCAKLGIRVAHVEAGLRSFDRSMPEEINRIVTDALADLLLTPSEDADKNLLREGVPMARIKLVGNIMIDSLVDNLAKARSTRTLEELGLESGRFIYVTLHRPSNVDFSDRLSAIMTALGHIGQQLPVVFPVHPRTQKMFTEFGLMPQSRTGLIMLGPVGYHRALHLEENARLVITDSGGVQEETTYFRTPCLTLRPNTERPITVTEGSNRLTGIDRLISDVNDVLSGPERTGKIPHFWDGCTAARCLRQILDNH